MTVAKKTSGVSKNIFPAIATMLCPWSALKIKMEESEAKRKPQTKSNRRILRTTKNPPSKTKGSMTAVPTHQHNPQKIRIESQDISIVQLILIVYFQYLVMLIHYTNFQIISTCSFSSTIFTTLVFLFSIHDYIHPPGNFFLISSYISSNSIFII